MIRIEDHRLSSDPWGDDTNAFERALLAANPDTSIYDGRSDTIVLDPRRYHITRRLRVHGSPKIVGANRPSFTSSAASSIEFHGISGLWLPGTRGYDRAKSAGQRIQDVGIVCHEIPALPFSWDTVLSEYSLIRIPNDHQFTYRVIRGGRTSLTPALPWSPSTGFSVGSRIAVSNGHFYTCLQGGVSGLSEPLGPNPGETWNFDLGSVISDGGCIWVESGSCFVGIADVATSPFSMADDLWAPNTVFEYNAVVRVEGDYENLYWLGPQEGGPISGTSGSSAPSPGTVGTTTSDGVLVWTRLSTVPYLWKCGEAILQPCRFPGIAIDSYCDIDGVYIENASGNAVHIQASGDIAPARNANFFRLRDLSQWGSHGFIRVRGSDASAGYIMGCQSFGRLDLGEADYAYRDGSLSGCTWIQNVVEGPGGAPFMIESPGGQSIIHGAYNESFHKCHAESSVVVDGGSGLLWTGGSSVVNVLEGKGIGGKSGPSGDKVYGALAGKRGVSEGAAFAFGSDRENLWFTATHTSKIASLLDHAWAIGLDPSVYGAVFSALVLTTEGHKAFKDDPSGAGRTWVSPGRNPAGMYVGPRASMAIDGESVDLGPCSIWWEAEIPTSGAWRKGDLIVLTNGSYDGAICTASGKFGTSQPPVFKSFILP